MMSATVHEIPAHGDPRRAELEKRASRRAEIRRERLRVPGRVSLLDAPHPLLSAEARLRCRVLGWLIHAPAAPVHPLRPMLVREVGR